MFGHEYLLSSTAMNNSLFDLHIHTVESDMPAPIVCNIRESVDSLCRDGADLPIVRVHRKAFLTRERSRSKPFCAPSYSIPAFLYPKIPPK